MTKLRGRLSGYDYIPPRGFAGQPLVKASDDDGDAMWGGDGHVLNYTTSYNAGVTDDTAAIQAAVDAVTARGGGDVYLGQIHKFTGITIRNHCVRLIYAGSSARSKSVNYGGRMLYYGTGTAIKVDGANASGNVIQGVQFENFRLENKGTGTVGLHLFNAQNCVARKVHVAEFSQDNILLQCNTKVSTIYNSFYDCTGISTSGAANGLRMVEATGKTVNNNTFVNCSFATNRYGIKQDTACNDNLFVGLDIGSCTTGAHILGRTTLEEANIESCTTGLILGGQAVIRGSLHFGSNTTDVDNPDNRPIFASMHGGDAGASITFSTRNTGMGMRGQAPPAEGGINLSDIDGDPRIQIEDDDQIVFEAGSTVFSKNVTVPDLIAQDISSDNIVLSSGSLVDFNVKQVTVGGAGGAAALPGTPTGYIEIKVSTISFVVPYYPKS